MSELANCKTCGGKVSSTAPACPHCGEQAPGVALHCPKCGSATIEQGKRGFSGGKCVAGAVVLGPLGMLAGLHGRKNTEFHCLSCGKKWKPKEIK